MNIKRNTDKGGPKMSNTYTANEMKTILEYFKTQPLPQEDLKSFLGVIQTEIKIHFLN